jgi:hypothetical protein
MAPCFKSWRSAPRSGCVEICARKHFHETESSAFRWKPIDPGELQEQAKSAQLLALATVQRKAAGPFDKPRN